MPSPTNGTLGTAAEHRSYGNENWEFSAAGLMRVRHASINDLAIDESERRCALAPGSAARGLPRAQ
ncbi:MAG: DUF1348 family protein [Halioglobus sp.]